tara:strand:- start:222 stop:842 length:621 start_codon:yes stop_codon:yes gene_type:complete
VGFIILAPMKKVISVLLVSIPLVVLSQSNLNKWNNTLYNKYDASKFQKLEIVNQLIEPNNIDYKLLNAAIFYCTNIQRIKYDKKPFTHSIALEKAAQSHSKDMVTQNFFSHKNTVKEKRTLTDRLSLVGIDNGYRAENISNNFEKKPTYWSLASKIVDGWMKSSGHRENILNDKYNYLGCGVYYYKNLEWKGYFWVKATQNFSSRG